jgi:hypothetical protein
MKYEIHLPSFEQQDLMLEVRFLFRPRILINNKPIKKKENSNEMVLKRDDGLSSVIRFLGQFPDPVPALEMDEEVFHVISPLSWMQRIIAVLPVVFATMIVGVWGFLIGLVPAYINFWLLRLQVQKLEKNLIIFAVYAGTVLISFMLRTYLISSQLGLS